MPVAEQHVEHAIVPPDRLEVISTLLFRETTTIGFRYRREARRELTRRTIAVKTRYGRVRLKVSSDGDEVLQVQPEFADCSALAESTKVPLKEIQRAALAAWSPTERPAARRGGKDRARTARGSGRARGTQSTARPRELPESRKRPAPRSRETPVAPAATTRTTSPPHHPRQ